MQKKTDRQLDRQDGWTDTQLDRQADGCTYKQMDGQTNGNTEN